MGDDLIVGIALVASVILLSILIMNNAKKLEDLSLRVKELEQ